MQGDDGRKQGGKRIAACGSEFQKVRFEIGHVIHCRTQKKLLSPTQMVIVFCRIIYHWPPGQSWPHLTVFPHQNNHAFSYNHTENYKS
jgi:hypothetical protein